MGTSPLTPTTPNDPQIAHESEIRFAVVMYGGVSLAIYINGVAQELLSMVRATAPAGDGSKTALPASALSGAERIYRKASYLISNKADRRKERLAAGDEQARKDLIDKWLKEADSALTDAPDGSRAASPIRTQFIVDIISGTSAGGINGIFLAKALANGQEMRQLQQLWINEGDIALLINDRGSAEENCRPQNPPASLLNSRRMYAKLLGALTRMDGPGAAAQNSGEDCTSPYIKELDLFVTATDIQGLPMPLNLADKPVVERRYRNTFQFRYDNNSAGVQRNDFAFRHNPFLAYAARCTSSFPFAFEPMKLSDVDEALKYFPEYRGVDPRQWERFYRHYLDRMDDLPNCAAFPDRAFGDGGYLDNKPFSYAAETLARRAARVQVQRKLIYIEPSPDHPEVRTESKDRPNAAENVAAALFTLPRYETIRDDLQRVQDRNRMITRIQRILAQVDGDLDIARQRKGKTQEEELRKDGRGFLADRVSQRRHAQHSQKGISGDEEWRKLDLADVIAKRGWTHVAYHRLQIGVLTDNLAELIAGVLGIEKDSGHFQAIRHLIRAWRDDRYTEHRQKDKPTHNSFLVDFDLTYPLRRLAFVGSKINRRLQDAGQSEGARSELEDLQKFFNCEYCKLVQAELELQPGRLPSELRNMIRGTGIRTGDLDLILGDGANGSPAISPDGHHSRQEEECKRRALSLLQNHMGKNIDKIAAELTKRILPVRIQSDRDCLDRIVSGRWNDNPGPEAAEIREQLRDFYQNYPDFDAFIFPIQQGTEIGENALTEITRISPEDAVSLIDENRPDEECLKLAGTSLGHFGAFLDASWRRNDILWGRLDGAERLIAALLPDEKDLAVKLALQAQAAIVCEEIKRCGEEEMNTLLAESLMRTEAGRPAPEALSSFLERLKSGATEETRDTLARIDTARVRDHYLRIFPAKSRLQPEPALRCAARAATVTGKILEGLSEEYGAGSGAARWIARLGAAFWGMIEVAAPHSIFNMMFRHWLKLIYLFETLLILSGILTAKPELTAVGWRILAATAIVHAGITLLGDIIQSRINRWKSIKICLFVLFALLTALGLLKLTELWSKAQEFLGNYAGLLR